MCDLQLLQGTEEVSDKLNEGNCVYFGNKDVINLGQIVLENYQPTTATTTANPSAVTTEAIATTTEAPVATTTANPEEIVTTTAKVSD